MLSNCCLTLKKTGDANLISQLLQNLLWRFATYVEWHFSNHLSGVNVNYIKMSQESFKTTFSIKIWKILSLYAYPSSDFAYIISSIILNIIVLRIFGYFVKYVWCLACGIHFLSRSAKVCDFMYILVGLYPLHRYSCTEVFLEWRFVMMLSSSRRFFFPLKEGHKYGLLIKYFSLPWA